MKALLTGLLALLFLAASGSCADLLEQLGFAKRKTTNSTATSLSALSQDQMVGGLKEALGKGVQQAVATLGKTDGFRRQQLQMVADFKPDKTKFCRYHGVPEYKNSLRGNCVEYHLSGE